MADKKENEFTSSGDISKVRGIDPAGNSIQSTVDQLTDKMRDVTPDKSGLMNKDGFFNRGAFSDANGCKRSGIYNCGSTAINTPTSGYYVFHVLQTGPYIIQIAFNLNSLSMFYRKSITSGDTWDSWARISIV